MRVELTEVLWLNDHHDLSLMQLAELSGQSAEEIQELVDYGVIDPIDPGAAERTFAAECIAAARTACRLRTDFELDAGGLALTLALLDRVHDLEAQLRDMRARLPGRIR